MSICQLQQDHSDEGQDVQTRISVTAMAGVRAPTVRWTPGTVHLRNPGLYTTPARAQALQAGISLPSLRSTSRSALIDRHQRQTRKPDDVPLPARPHSGLDAHAGALRPL